MDSSSEPNDDNLLQVPGSSSLEAPTITIAKPRTSRRSVVALVASVVILIGLVSTVSLRIHRISSENRKDRSAKVQDVDLNSLSSVATPFQGGDIDKLVVNGQLQANQGIILTPNDAPAAGTLGQIYFDKTANDIRYFNGTNFLSVANSENIANLQNQLSSGTVTSVQNQTGAIRLLGGGGLTVSTAGRNISLNLPQNLTTTASPTFGALITNTIQQTAGGQNISINAGNDGIIFTANGKTYLLPNTGNDTQTICTDQALCLVGGGTAVLLGQLTAQADTTSYSAIFIDKQNSGNLIHLQQFGTDRLVVANNGDTTITANLTVTGSSSFATAGVSGVLSVNTITPTGTLNVGATGESFNLFGDENSSFYSQDSSNHRVTVNFQATDTVDNDVTYFFNRSEDAGNYEICTSADNCSAALGGVTAPIQGTVGYIPKFTDGQEIGDSAISDDGTAITINGEDLNVTGGSLITNSIAPTSALTVGDTSLAFTLQGSASSTITAGSGSTLTSVGFTGSPTGLVTYRFERAPTAGPGTYNVCTTAGNCTGGSVSSGGGTTNTIALFTGSQSIGNSILTQSGTSSITVGGGLNVTGTLGVNTITPTSALTIGDTSQTFTIQGSATSTLTATGNSHLTTVGFTGTASADVRYNFDRAASSGIYTICTTANTGLCNGGNGITSLNSLTGAVTIANATGSGSTITIDNASTSSKGIASFNSTNFSVSSGAVNAIQDINSTATPTFGGLTLGLASTTTGSVALKNSSNSNTFTLQSGASSGNLTFTLPTADGSSGNCLTTNGSGALSFAACQSGGSGVASLDGLSGTLTIANSSGSGSTVTIDNASTSAKGIASFSSTNFSVSSGAVNTIQNINSTATPTFGTLTLGAASSSTGSIALKNATNSNTLTLQSGVSGSNLTLTLPTADASTSGACLVSNASGVLSFTSNTCLTGTGGGGGTGLTGTGTNNKIAKYTGTDTLGDSSLTDTGSALTVAVDTTIQGDLSVGASDTIFTNNISQTAGGNPITISASGDNITFTALGIDFTFQAGDSSPTQYICASGSSCVAGGGVAVLLGPVAVQADTSTNSSIFLNKTGASGNLLQLQQGGSDKFKVAYNGDTTLATAATLKTNSIVQTAGGNPITISASGDNITFTALGINYTFQAGDSSPNQLICASGSSCVAGGGTAVLLGPSSVQTDGGTNASIFINKTGASGNIIQLRKNGTDKFVVDNSGNTTFGGSVTGASSATLGTASTTTGSVALKNATNSNTLTLQSGVTGSNLTLTLPTADGSSGNCLTTNGSGVLSFAACQSGGSGVASLDGLTGTLTIANSSGGGSTITIDNASTSTKGIASFNSTNFSVTSGAVNTAQNINSTATPTFGTLTLGASTSVTGSIALKNSTNSNTLTLQSGTTGSNLILTLPTADGSSGNCLTTNGSGVLSFSTCQSGGSGVSSLDGLSGALTIANSSGTGSTVTIDNATTASKGIASFNSSNFQVSSGAVNTIQNIGLTSTPIFNGLTLGTASTTTGSIALKNSTNSNTLTLQSGVSGANMTFTLPTAHGSSGNCLTTNGSGTLSFSACQSGGSGVTSLDGLTGTLTIANSSGTGSTVTIDNATTAAKGIASFNSTNFQVTSGAVNTVQNIGITATPIFNGLTLGTASSVTGSIALKNSSGANTLTLQSGVTTGNITFTLPTADATVSGSCLTSNAAGVLSFTSTACVTTGSLSGSFLAKGSADTSSAAITASNYLYGFINSSSVVASGVLSLDNGSNTGNGLLVTGTGTPGAGNALIKANNVGGGGNLIDLQLSGTSRFSVTTAGNVAAAGTYNSNTFTSSGLSFGAAGTATVQSAASQSLNLTGKALSTFSTTAGNIALTPGSGTIDVTSTTLIRANAGLTIQASGVNYTFGGSAGTICTNANNCNFALGSGATSNAVLLSPLAPQIGYVWVNSSLNGNSLAVTTSITGGSLTISGAANLQSTLIVSAGTTLQSFLTVTGNYFTANGTITSTNGNITATNGNVVISNGTLQTGYIIGLGGSTCFAATQTCNAIIANNGAISGLSFATSGFSASSAGNITAGNINGVTLTLQSGTAASLQHPSNGPAEIRGPSSVVQATASGGVSINVTTAVTVGGSSGNLTVNGLITYNGLGGESGSTRAVCYNGSAGGGNGRLRICSSGPNSGDFAEMYPVTSDVSIADVVVTNGVQFNTYNEGSDGHLDYGSSAGTTSQLTKASQPYSQTLFGVVSNINNTDGQFNVVGNNFASGVLTKPVALSGRVLVHITTENGQIEPGDYLTASATMPGYAMKATQAGYVIGKALSAYTSSSPGSVMVFVGTEYYPGPSVGDVIQNGSDAQLASLGISGSLNVSGLTTLTDLTVSGNTTLAHLTVNGSSVFNGTLTVNGHIISGNTSGNTTAVLGAAACASPTVTINGNDTSGTIIITTGSGCASDGILATVNFANNYVSAPRVVVSPAETNAAKLQYFNGMATTSSFTIDTNTIPTSATTYKYNYIVVQ